MLEGGEPPLELWYAWQNKRWGMTPNEVDETEAGLLSRMAVAWDAWERAQRALSEFQRQPTHGKAQWLKDNPEMASEWAKRSGVKAQLAEFRRRQMEKKAAISG